MNTQLIDNNIIECNYKNFNRCISDYGHLFQIPDNYELLSQELFENVNSRIIVHEHKNKGKYYKAYYKNYKDIYIAKTIKSNNKDVLSHFIISKKLKCNIEETIKIDKKFKILNNILTLQ